MRNVILTLVGVVVVGVLAAIIFIYSGVYNVAADKENGSLKTWALSTAMDSSVESRAKGIKVPDLSSKEGLLEGAEHYDAMCTSCHGAPGRERAEFAPYLNPEPPKLVDAAKGMSAAELFWVTKHGVEMTGMPAWGPTHSDEKIWDMVALMKKFSTMSPEQYSELVKQAGGDEHDHDGEEGKEGHHHGADQAHADHHHDADHEAGEETEGEGDEHHEAAAELQEHHDHGAHEH